MPLATPLCLPKITNILEVYSMKKQSTKTGQLAVEQEEIVTLPDVVRDFCVSDDGLHVVFAKPDGQNWALVRDGEIVAKHEMCWDPVYSPDGEQLAYEAMMDGQRVLVVEGNACHAWDNIEKQSLTFSANGKRWAFVARDYYNVIDTRQVFHVDERYRVVVDGIDSPCYDEVRQGPLFSPDGKHLAYAARMRDKWFVVVDGEPGPVFEGIAKRSLSFSADSEHVAYAGHRGAQSWVMLDEMAGPPFEVIMPNGPTFRPDGVLEYVALSEGVLRRVRQQVTASDGELPMPADPKNGDPAG
jgi:hypothetical protein